MLNVLHFYKTYYPYSYGGIEQVIFQLCEGSLNYGINSKVLALSNNNNKKLIQFKHHIAEYSYINFICSSTPFSFSAITHFRQLALEADLIHFHFPFPFMDIVYFLSKNTKPTLVSYHSDIVKQKFLFRIYKPLMKRFLHHMKSIVVSSLNYVNTSLILQNYRSKTIIIPFGLDQTSYPQQNTIHEELWRNKFSERFFLFIGTLRYYKGLNILLEAAKYVSYPIVLIGTGPMEKELKKLKFDLKLTNIHFLGALSDVDKAALLKICYCIIFPSNLRAEAFGITLLEGLMYGKPLITCEIGTGTTYINIHQRTGLVVPPSLPLALVKAMHDLWNDPVKAKKYGKQARDRFDALFTSERMIKSYTNLYRKIINQ